MLKRFASVLIVAAMICTLSGSVVSANTPPKSDAKAGGVAARPSSGTKAGKEAETGGKLKADVLKLVADAKAGKTGTAIPRRGQQPALSNNLSKRTKIAIGVGIAVAVVVTIIAVKARCDGFCE